MLNKIIALTCLSFISFYFPKATHAASGNIDLMTQNWPFNGIFGRFDNSSLTAVTRVNQFSFFNEISDDMYFNNFKIIFLNFNPYE